VPARNTEGGDRIEVAQLLRGEAVAGTVPAGHVEAQGQNGDGGSANVRHIEVAGLHAVRAQVSMDVIAGNSEVGSVKAVSTAISSHVVAIANFGDPGHVVGQSWDLGTATRAGLFPRSSAQLKLLTAFGGSGKIAAWCDANDPYCASGANLTAHLTYLNRYQNAAASFVLGKIGG
jgi:hypothetical protein